MGLNGSDVAKGAAEVVLADDQFGTITRAIKKGRGVLTNLSKFLLFLLSGNIAEVVVLRTSPQPSSFWPRRCRRLTYTRALP